MATFFLLVIFAFLIFLTLILLILKFLFNKHLCLNMIGVIWVIPITFLIIGLTIKLLNTKMELDKNEIYGNYIIDREKCVGKQADWQYNHYRFKITEENKIYFYITENEKIVKTFVGKIDIYEGSASPHLILKIDDPKFHIINDNPTLYREIWSFYYVFHSTKYQNVFFKKGNWKSIN